MHITTTTPRIQFFTKTAIHANGEVFDVCYAIVEYQGRMYTRIVGIRPHTAPVASESVIFALPKPKIATAYVEPIISPYASQTIFSRVSLFIVSQPTRAPNEY